MRPWNNGPPSTRTACAGFGLCLLAGFSPVVRAGDGPYCLTAIHCEPHFAQQSHWNALATLVSDAEARNIRLTIELEAQWATLIASDPQKIALLQQWVSNGHEIGAHHHDLAHVVWDGYSSLPAAAGQPGFLGTMAAFQQAFAPPFPFPCINTLSTPQPADWLPCAIHRTGNGVGMFSPISEPSMQVVNGQRVWQLDHAPLITGTTWNTQMLIDAYNAALPGQVVGAAFHPNNYDTPGERAQALGWLDFIAQQNPSGDRSLTASQIIEALTSRSDLNGDFAVNFTDVTELLARWGETQRWFDIDGSGAVGFGDLTRILAEWTP